MSQLKQEISFLPFHWSKLLFILSLNYCCKRCMSLCRKKLQTPVYADLLSCTVILKSTEQIEKEDNKRKSDLLKLNIAVIYYLT